MSIDPNLLIAAKLIHDECVKYGNCDCCKIKFACSFSGIPSTWKIPEPPPEPAERQRIEWLRMLPDDEMLLSIEPFFKCADCQWHGIDCSRSDKFNCNTGHVDWWHEVVSLEQFRKDVGLNNENDE